jgi:hypothetical protein
LLPSPAVSPIVPKLWKKGRGKLGPLLPLIGHWVASTDSPRGPMRCTRTVQHFGSQYLQLHARWEFGPVTSPTVYDELAMIGVGDDGVVSFWSYTSDGKRSHGTLADVTDLHPEAVGFEADMPAGRARMAYWPNADGGFQWVVESRTKKGWNRFTKHTYSAKTRSQ